MEHANQAFMMAFGMIVGVLILSTIVWVFSNIRSLPQTDDDIESVEQVTAFNQEYEVYDKKIMYGVDVISALNKALSNNEKYVQGNFLSGEGYNTDYIIDIQVTLKTALEESMTVTYLRSNGSTTTETEYTSGNGPSGTGMYARNYFTSTPSSAYCKLVYGSESKWSGTSLTLKTQTISTSVSAGVYHLMAGLSDNDYSLYSWGAKRDYSPTNGYTYGTYDSTMEFTDDMLEKDSTLKSLLDYSATMTQTVKNDNGNYGDGGWYQATWYPAVYDLKTRKFKCTNLVYSEKTSRVILMVFEEV